MIKVSVIIASYNSESTIEKCIDSVIAQTLKEMEIIVVNDGSTDNSTEILNKYSDKIKVLNIPHRGQGFARNVGIKASKGEYLGFVDADDTVEKEMYEKMLESAQQHNSQIVQCGINDIHENGSVQCRFVENSHVEITDRAEYIFDYFYKMKHTNEVCNKLIQKKFLIDNNLSFGDTSQIFSEDFKLNMDMIIRLDRISFIHDGMYNYYIKDTGHCRSDIIGRVGKIIHLFEVVLSQDMDKCARKGIECVAAITSLTYCGAAAENDPQKVMQFLSNKSLRKYMRTSMIYRSNIKHFLLMLAMLMSPVKLELIILKKKFVF